MQTDLVVLGSSCQFAFNVSLSGGIAPPSIAAASVVEFGATMPAGIPALKSGDIVDITGPGTGNATGLCGARVNTAGQLVVAWVNPTAGALTPAAGVHGVVITRV